ncbi:mechanosensitive ion channel domain-containing protein [Halococcus sp. IIIV-5B]|uniref:mechanosensitive ion channel domain-containing protein n=1 Tax=Halococcus sp. IIIV-5B TaxID=2321230 RepID=UPI000E75834D|nr:mechanosensitive ion channel domain-containing protein [Halococcus sp. IIIV-5B]RJS98096.1 mechanosensitive ion channel family protein [Halococcus sp. IIIV-5B]
MANLGTLIGNLLSGRISLVLVVGVLIVGVLVSYLVDRLAGQVLIAVGVEDAVEGTTSDRAAQRLGTSTVSVLAGVVALFVFIVFLVLALTVSSILDATLYLSRFIDFLPQLLVAALVVIFGLVLADRAELLASERLRNVKLPDAGLIPELIKYSIVFVAVLVALGQLDVADDALLVLFAAYAFGLVFLGGLACKDLLASSAAGFYLLLSEPVSIGDEVRIDGMDGIVQEIDVFAIHVENDTEEFIIPNHRVIRSGIVRVR